MLNRSSYLIDQEQWFVGNFVVDLQLKLRIWPDDEYMVLNLPRNRWYLHLIFFALLVNSHR